jgi:outer membrane protein assembly factor BamB
VADRSVPNHYQLLGVMADATAGQIRAAYREKAKLAHPDAGGSPELFRQLLDAYQVLSNPVRRRQYDDEKGIRMPSHSSDGGSAAGTGTGTKGWTGTKGDFTGSVEFPAYLRDITEKPWDTSRREEQDRDQRDRLDPIVNALPADVVWWWPDQAVAPPTVAGPLLVVPGAEHLVALATLTGHEVWRAELGARPSGRAAVQGDLAVVWTADGVAHGVDLGSGVRRWTAPVGAPGAGGLASAGRTIVAARADGRLVGVDPSSGASRWQAKLAAPASAALAVVPHDEVVVALTARSAEAVDARKGKHRWRIALRSGVELPPCTVGNTVWLAGGGAPGSLVRLDAATGAVRGTFRAGSAVAGLAADPDTGTVLTSAAGPPRLLAIDEGGRLHLSVDLPSVCAEPAFTESRAFVLERSGRILAVDRLRRAVVAAATVPFDPIGFPMVVGEQLVMMARDGRLWATEQPFI